MDNETKIPGEEHGPFRSVPFVARRLEWSERTIRHRCVSIIDWIAGQKEAGQTVVAYTSTSGTIPSLRLGALHRIPVWWMQAMIEAGERPPEPCCVDS